MGGALVMVMMTDILGEHERRHLAFVRHDVDEMEDDLSKRREDL